MGFISEAHAQSQSGGGGPYDILIMIALMVAVFYFFLIRPQSKRAKEQRTMLSSLQKGDEIVTGSGMLGKISDIGDNYLLLEISDGVLIRSQKHAVHALVPKGTIKSDL